ncbi:hypothetical protein BJ165DRAFT_1357622 [Panaeolus papilionaceus]|nr:hypothetical protein BJ165DRAFT_1357622 [Panaeolus papilionaceus]
MSKKLFQEGLSYFKLAKYNESIEKFTLALKESEANAYLIYDTRSAAYAKLGNNKSAIIDARKTIQIAPERWQGYARAARLFLAVDKIDASLSMINLALQRLKDDEEDRRASFIALRKQVEERQLILERRQKRLINHVSKLPVELLTEVFQLLTTEDPTAIVSLLHVCTHWRQIIKSSPSFWSTLTLGRRRPKEKAVQWIKYSKGRIRELKIKPGLSSSSGWPSESLRGIRWDSLSKCELHQWNIASYLNSISQPGVITNLTSLFLDCDPYEPNFDKAFIFTANPHLRHLRLHNVPLRSSLQLEFPKVTLLQVPPDVPSLDLPNLTTLHLKCVRTHIFMSTTLPGLSILRLYDVVDNAIMTQLNIWSIEGLKLTELTLNGTPIGAGNLLRILSTSPELRKLEICRRDNLINDVLTHLSTPLLEAPGSTTATSTPNILCPLLTDVNFSHCKDVRTGPLVKFIKSRHPEYITSEGSTSSAVIKPVQSLVVDGCDLVDPEWIEWMRTKVPRVSCIYMKKTAKFR